ncbi:ubiquitin domain-containing protein [Saccharomycopsis crataegensis]|uniref:Ubiquitin domain-containing protein n=1 Tax=Saccharomycopsis crataegensis TaxID=43959 RepID=A0AAV5QSI0_9ASCO|nr:ubiquitin domain-containing protein [Saccharomycopsis crataegensis]
MSEEITINIKSAGDKKYEIKASKETTISEFKDQVAEVSSIPSDQQRLIYSGRVLKDQETLAFYKVQDGHTIHMVKSAAKKTDTSGSTSASLGSNQNNNNIPTNISAGTHASDPLAGLTDARYAGYNIPMPSADMFGADGMPSEDQMSSMMDNPMFQEMMNSMLSNPAMLDTMINQNPMLRSMGPQAREILQSPMFRQMMSNPQMMRNAMSMQRAMGGSAPGGFGAGSGTGAGSFPAPGPAVGGNDASTASATTTTDSNSNATSAAASNPFAAMFPGGAPSLFGQPGDATNSMYNPELLASLLGAGAGAGAGSQAPVDNRPPEERYESQLRQLNDMGFFDFDRNVNALRRSGGSVQGAIDALLNGSV